LVRVICATLRRSVFGCCSTSSSRTRPPIAQHTTYLIVETDDAANRNAFLKPGAGRCLAEITPVVDESVP